MAKKNKNILLFIEGLGAGGKERQFVELLKYLKKKSDLKLFVILLKEDIHYKEFLPLSIPFKVYGRSSFFSNLLLPFSVLLYCIKNNIGLINSWGNLPTVFSIPTKILYRIPIINFQIQNAPSELTTSLYFNPKMNFFFSDLIIANSIAGLKTYSPPDKKSKVIYNGFVESRITKLKDKNEIVGKLGLENKTIVGMVASYSSTKDYKTYIESALTVLSSRDDVVFLGFGAGDKDRYVKIIPNKYKNKICLFGSSNTIEDYINIFDIGILSTFTEGISNSILEYMALGKPVIATDGGGTPELVLDNITGFLIPQQSPKTLAEKINLLLDNRSLREKLGEKGKARIQRNFSIDIMGEEFDEIFNKYCKLK